MSGGGHCMTENGALGRSPSAFSLTPPDTSGASVDVSAAVVTLSGNGFVQQTPKTASPSLL